MINKKKKYPFLKWHTFAEDKFYNQRELYAIVRVCELFVYFLTWWQNDAAQKSTSFRESTREKRE